MRSHNFLVFLQNNYNHERAANLANNRNIRGGWEVWLQVEIALAFVNQEEGTRICQREEPYPAEIENQWITYSNQTGVAQVTSHRNQAARCDFCLCRHNPHGQMDYTYVELKCINPNAPNPLQDAWERFDSDIRKVQAIRQLNLQVPWIALLVTYGQFNPPLPQFSAGINARVWDPNNNNVSRIENVIQGGPDRLFIVAAS